MLFIYTQQDSNMGVRAPLSFPSWDCESCSVLTYTHSSTEYIQAHKNNAYFFDTNPRCCVMGFMLRLFHGPRAGTFLLSFGVVIVNGLGPRGDAARR